MATGNLSSDMVSNGRFRKAQIDHLVATMSREQRLAKLLRLAASQYGDIAMRGTERLLREAADVLDGRADLTADPETMTENR